MKLPEFYKEKLITKLFKKSQEKYEKIVELEGIAEERSSKNEEIFLQRLETRKEKEEDEKIIATDDEPVLPKGFKKDTD